MCHALLQRFWFRDNKFSWVFWCKNYGCGLCLIVWNCKYLNVGMSDVIHGLWMMNLDKSWHAISLKWLVIYVVMNSVWTIMLHWWHGIGMRWSSISPNWEECDGMKSTWNMNIWMRMGYKGWREVLNAWSILFVCLECDWYVVST